MQRKITEDEERCYRLRHHNFAGFTTLETAKIMRITPVKVRLLLKSLRAKAPQLFPILTFHQHLIYWLCIEIGLTQQEIANYLGISQSTICGILSKMKKKGIPFLNSSGFGSMAAYEKGMDNHILYKF